MKKVLIALGFILIIAGGAWKFAIAPQNDLRFPVGWTWEVNTLGLFGYADEESGEFSTIDAMKDDPINLTERIVKAESTDQTNRVKIIDSYITREPATNVVTWEYSSETIVDATTGKIAEGDLEGDYYFLPRSVDKNETYIISNSSYLSLPMEFQNEEIIAGIPTYKFAYYGDLPNTSSYIGWVDVEEGQEITCFEFELEYWVEPITGEVVQYREWCPGDYVVDTESGDRLFGIQRWAGETTGDDLIRRASVINGMLSAYNMNNMIIPIGLAGVGIILIIVGFVLGKPATTNPKREDA